MSARELLRRPAVHWWLAVALFVGTIIGAWELSPWKGLNQWLGNTMPEFLGAAIITLIVGAYLRDDARRSYVKAMRSVRAEFSARADQGGVPVGSVQESMAGVVPAIAGLYFGGRTPSVRSAWAVSFGVGLVVVGGPTDVGV